MATKDIQGAFTIEPAIYHRARAGYDSVLQSGAESFGASNSEKEWSAYNVMLASDSVNSPISVAIRTGLHPKKLDDAIVLEVDDPQGAGLQTLFFNGYYLGDRITASGVNNPLRVAGRVFDVKVLNTMGFGRTA